MTKFKQVIKLVLDVESTAIGESCIPGTKEQRDAIRKAVKDATSLMEKQLAGSSVVVGGGHQGNIRIVACTALPRHVKHRRKA